MPKRLTKIYTRTGDQGTTGLADGTRVDKDSQRVQAMGDVDELNACIGLLNSHLPDQDDIKETLVRVQNDLFDIGAELAMPGHRLIADDRVNELETQLDHFNETLPALKEFILPGGHPNAAFCHLARTVCRRAERSLFALSKESDVQPALTHYLNRLSDLLFVFSRVLARRNGGQEVHWQSRSKPEQ